MAKLIKKFLVDNVDEIVKKVNKSKGIDEMLNGFKLRKNRESEKWKFEEDGVGDYFLVGGNAEHEAMHFTFRIGSEFQEAGYSDDCIVGDTFRIKGEKVHCNVYGY
jgi:hypothetical protein